MGVKTIGGSGQISSGKQFSGRSSAKWAHAVRLDLNNEVFQQEWFALEKPHLVSVLEALVKLASLSWEARVSAGSTFKAADRQKAPVSASYA